LVKENIYCELPLKKSLKIPNG